MFEYRVLIFLLEELTVFLVHLLNLPNVHSATNDVVIKLIAICYSCQLRTWKTAERMEIKTVEASQG